MRHYLFIILTFLTITSCEEDFHVSNNSFEENIVLNSIFTEDSTWVVELRTSSNLYDSESSSLPVEDAVVFITELNGQNQCNLQYVGNGIYRSQDCKPHKEKSYRIRAFSNAFGSISATSSIPEKAVVTINKAEILNNEYKVDFTIEERSIIDNFFIWDIVNVAVKKDIVDTNKSFNPKVDIRKWISDISEDIGNIKENSLSTDISSIGAGIVGNQFNTSIVTERIDGSGSIPPDQNPELYEIKTMLRVMTASKELYNYFKSIENYLGHLDYNSSLSEPNKLYDNIQGGLGIFAGYSVEYVEIPQ